MRIDEHINRAEPSRDLLERMSNLVRERDVDTDANRAGARLHEPSSRALGAADINIEHANRGAFASERGADHRPNAAGRFF